MKASKCELLLISKSLLTYPVLIHILPLLSDYNECENSEFCIPGAECINIYGGAICLCPAGFDGDGKVNGTGCTGKDGLI